MRRRSVAALGVAGVVAGLLGGCTPPGATIGPHFVISRDPSESWQPVDIRIEALVPGQRVTVSADVVPSGAWSSRVTYSVPADGVVDLATAVPQLAPFTKPDAMGLLWSLANEGGASADDIAWGEASVTVELTASVDGRVVATDALHRIGDAENAPVRAAFDDPFLNNFYEPTTVSIGLRPAVLVFDSVEDGTRTGAIAAGQIAALGYPALDLTLSTTASGPAGATTLQAERFVAAINWLRTQPGVDADRVFVFGASRATQFALWTAVSYPDLVYGAIAPSGTTGVVCTSPVPAPSITIHGAWVPCVTGTREVTASSVLALGDITGPVILACGGQDEVMTNACAWMTAGERARGNQVGDTFLRATGSTHALYLPPYTPLALPPSPAAQATEDARMAFWNAVERTLKAASRT